MVSKVAKTFSKCLRFICKRLPLGSTRFNVTIICSHRLCMRTMETEKFLCYTDCTLP